MSDSDDDRFAPGSAFLTDRDERLTVAGARMGTHGRIIRFEEVSERDGAEGLRGRTLTITADQRRELDETEFWPEQLVGLTAVTTDGVEWGAVVDVALGAAQDRIVVEVTGRTVEIPFVDDLVPEVDLPGGRIVIRPITGLLSAEQE